MLMYVARSVSSSRRIRVFGLVKNIRVRRILTRLRIPVS